MTVTNGVLIRAGSQPSRAKSSGSSEPTSVPQVTTRISVIGMISAAIGDGATKQPIDVADRAEENAQGQRRSAARARRRPTTAAGVISLVVSARMMSVADWLPEFPPQETMSGRKSTSQATLSIVSWYDCEREDRHDRAAEQDRQPRRAMAGELEPGHRIGIPLPIGPTAPAR